MARTGLLPQRGQPLWHPVGLEHGRGPDRPSLPRPPEEARAGLGIKPHRVAARASRGDHVSSSTFPGCTSLMEYRHMILLSGFVYKKSSLCQRVESSQNNNSARQRSSSSLAVGGVTNKGGKPNRYRLRARPGIFRLALWLEAQSRVQESQVWSDDRA